MPRRLVYVVDRRAVVDQATEEATKIKAAAADPALRVSTLRGQLADNREWLDDPAATAIIVGTVDMIGSRLLFSGYGVSPRTRSYHAGLLGSDTLVVLDESHLVLPFERLLAAIERDDRLAPQGEVRRALVPRFRLLCLSATGREQREPDRDGRLFRLDDRDRADPVVARRLGAAKRLIFRECDDKRLAERLAEAAWELSGGEGAQPARVLVYCSSRNVVDDAAKRIGERARKAKRDIESPVLFVGARRVQEREQAADELRRLGFLSGGNKPEKPAFVVATSAGEVGVDLDADHMVCDLVPFERMVQRLGRVNRLGKGNARVVVFETIDPKLPDALKNAAGRARKLFDALPRHADGSFDASPAALDKLRSARREAVGAATAPASLYPALTRPLVEAWSMTSLAEHSGRPEVQPWLRGWVDEDAQTTLIWRTYLPVRVGDEFQAPTSSRRSLRPRVRI